MREEIEPGGVYAGHFKTGKIHCGYIPTEGFAKEFTIRTTFYYMTQNRDGEKPNLTLLA